METPIVLTVAALLLLTVSDLLFKVESIKEKDTPVLEFFFYMSLFAFGTSLALGFGDLELIFSDLPNLWYGALIGLTAVGSYNCYLSAFSGLPSATNITLFRMSLVPALLFSVLLLNEPLSVWKILGVVCCLLAIVLFTGKDFSAHVNTRFLLMSLCACLLAGFITPLTRFGTLHGASSGAVLISRFLFMTVFSAILLSLRHMSFRIHRRALLLALLCGVLLGVECFVVLRASTLGQVSMVVPITSMSFILAGVASVFLFKEKLSPNRIAALALAALTVVFIAKGNIQ